MSETEFDAVVVGAGQGGIPLAVNLAEEGWRVALVERRHLGGTCVNIGCTPTKTMVASARAAHVARTAGRLGVETGDVEVDLRKVVARKDEIVESFRSGLQGRVDRDGLELVRGEARFAGQGLLEVETDDGGSRRLRSDRIVLNVGMRAAIPPIPGLDDVPYLTEEGLMALEEPPEHLMVVGGGYIGCEFGQMFRRFGSRVTVLQAGDQLLPAEDEDIAGAVLEAFRDEGIEVHLDTMASEVELTEDEGVRVTAEGAHRLTVEGTHLLMATGRRPNTDGLNLEAVGLEADRRGHVPVDEVYRTEAPGVWAIGDVNGYAPFTNVSYDDFRILFENWVNGASMTRTDRHPTRAVFVDPPAAAVGLNEKQAAERGVDYVSATTPMGHVARGIETGETRGLMKVLGDPDTRRILGASMVGLHADEVIHLFTVMMDGDLTWDVLERGVYVHPAVAEALPVLVRKLEEGGGYA